MDDEASVVREISLRQSLEEILSEPFDVCGEIEKLDGGELIKSILKKNLGEEYDITEIDDELIKNVYNSVENFFGKYTAERVKEILIVPRQLKEISEIDLDSVDPIKSKRYVQALLDITNVYLNGENWKRTEALLWAMKKLINNITGRQRKPFEVEMLINSALYSWKLGDYENAELHSKDALSLAEGMGDKKLIARCYHILGVVYGDYVEDKGLAIEYDERCLSVLDEINDGVQILKMKASVHNNLGVAYHKMAEEKDREENLRNAARNYELGIGICQDIGYKRMEGWLLFNIGEVYALLGEFEKADEASISARKIFEELEDKRGLSGVEMCDAVIEKERGNLEEALSYINKSLELRNELKEPRRIADALILRGDIYSSMGKFGDAREDYNSALEIYKRLNSADGIKRAEAKLFN
ncbi:MAG: tetratricopeptide repeat protein [Nanoarchaeota archaeon]|nr:tetratricopeptide repeat protein [Nanoarchaeota archaeon]